MAIAGGALFSLGLRGDGSVVGWGDNTYNQTNIPAGLTNVIGITAAAFQGVALIGSAPPVEEALLVSPRGTGGEFSVMVPTQNGRVYSLEYKDSLAAANWVGLPLVAGSGGDVQLSDPSATSNQRFYRVRRW